MSRVSRAQRLLAVVGLGDLPAEQDRAAARGRARRAANAWYRVGRRIREGIHLQVGLARASCDSWPFGGADAADEVRLLDRGAQPVGELREHGIPCGIRRDDVDRRRAAGDEALADQLLAGDRLRRRAEGLGEVQRLAPAERAERAGEQDQRHARRRRLRMRRRPGGRRAPRARPPAAGSTSTCGTAGQNDAAAERAEDRRQQRQPRGDHHRDAEREDRAHLARGVEVGQREHEHRHDHDRAGAEDRRAGALGGGRHRRADVLRARAARRGSARRSAGSSRCPRRTSARSGSRSTGR